MKALIIVDIQDDFLPGGALAVNEGDTIIPIVNELQKTFDCIIASQDWHPGDHGSFAVHYEGGNIGDLIDFNGLEQILWPVHCVQGSKGAEFSQDLDTTKFHTVIQKGTDKTVDSYSAFFDNGKRKQTALDAVLKEKGIDKLYFVGIATDYCVKFSVLDALELGYKVHVIEDACRGVDLSSGDVDKALREMENKGAKIIHSKSLLLVNSI